MELVKEFGIDPKLLIAQIVNFLIILFLLKKFLYKPVMDMLADRKNKIKEGLDQAEEARLLLEKAREEEKEILQKAQARSEKMFDSAKAQASELLQEAKEQAKEESQRIIEDAQKSIEKQTEKVKGELARHVSELSVDFLKKALSKNISPKVQKEVLSETLKKVKRAD